MHPRKSQSPHLTCPIWPPCTIQVSVARMPWASTRTWALSTEGAVQFGLGAEHSDLCGPGPTALPPALRWRLLSPSVPFLGLPASLPLFWFPEPGDLSQLSTLVRPSIKTWGERIAPRTFQLISACGPTKFGDVVRCWAKCQLMVEPSPGLLYSLIFSSHSVCQVRLSAGNRTEVAAQKYDSAYLTVAWP